MARVMTRAIVLALAACVMPAASLASDAQSDPAARLEQSWLVFSNGVQEAQRSLVDRQCVVPARPPSWNSGAA